MAGAENVEEMLKEKVGNVAGLRTQHIPSYWSLFKVTSDELKLLEMEVVWKGLVCGNPEKPRIETVCGRSFHPIFFGSWTCDVFLLDTSSDVFFFYGEAPRAQGQVERGELSSGCPKPVVSPFRPSQGYFWSTLVESREEQQVANFPTSFVGYPAGFYVVFHIFVHV